MIRAFALGVVGCVTASAGILVESTAITVIGCALMLIGWVWS